MRSNTPFSSITQMVFVPWGVTIEIPMVNNDFSVCTTGLMSVLTGGFVGPNQIPQRSVFTFFVRMLGGRFMIVTYTGHRLWCDDLNTGIPSVDKETAKCSGLVRKPPCLVSGSGHLRSIRHGSFHQLGGCWKGNVDRPSDLREVERHMELHV